MAKKKVDVAKEAAKKEKKAAKQASKTARSTKKQKKKDGDESEEDVEAVLKAIQAEEAKKVAVTISACERPTARANFSLVGSGEDRLLPQQRQLSTPRRPRPCSVRCPLASLSSLAGSSTTGEQTRATMISFGSRPGTRATVMANGAT